MYFGMSPDEDEGRKTAQAAFVLSMNALRKMREHGLISAKEFDDAVVNAFATAEPEAGSQLEQMLHANMNPETIASQDQRRGITRD